MNVQVSMIFLFGLIFGSFLNVCIYRLPKKQSIVWPGSHCPSCKNSIPFWQNIPVLSYIFLAGKCANCKFRISLIYPLVEILTGILLVVVWQHYGLTLSFFHYSILVLFLLPISFIDLDTRLILNVLTFPGIIVGLLSSVFLNQIPILNVVSGLFLGGGFLWCVGLLGNSVFKQESMGGGDIKLGAMIGVFLGPKVLIALFLAFFLALPVIAIGLSTKRLKIGSTVPFGPFISLAAVIIVCYGQALLHQYLNFVGSL